MDDAAALQAMYHAGNGHLHSLKKNNCTGRCTAGFASLSRLGEAAFLRKLYLVCIRRLSIWQRKRRGVFGIAKEVLSAITVSIINPHKSALNFTASSPPTTHTTSASHAVSSSSLPVPPRLLSCPGGSLLDHDIFRCVFHVDEFENLRPVARFRKLRIPSVRSADIRSFRRPYCKTGDRRSF